MRLNLRIQSKTLQETIGVLKHLILQWEVESRIGIVGSNEYCHLGSLGEYNFCFTDEKGVFKDTYDAKSVDPTPKEAL